MSAKKKNQKITTQKSAKKPKEFPIIGIGASAGGLDALKQFFSSISDDSDMAYIVVVHMMAGQKSLMPELLQKVVNIPVLTAKNGDLVKPNHIYVNAPGRELKISKGKIQIKIRRKEQLLHPITAFFSSLAKDQMKNATGIVLSGTGSDGSKGIKDIKINGGLVVVQEQSSAKYDGMPINAIKTGAVDFIFSPEEMPEKIHQYYHSIQDGKLPLKYNMDIDDPEWLNKVFSILRTTIGHDFSNYKKNTLLRRISRRMMIGNINSTDAYLDLLKDSPKEVEQLFHELLIGVTSFFRDPESFVQLQKKVLTKAFSQMRDEDTFRVWVPGCSTGEEVYSLAIIIKESLCQIQTRINLQVFGTDIDPTAIEKAREGLYPCSIEQEVNKERLKRFFFKEGEAYRIRKEIRDCAIFSIQNIIKDPPFSRLNLVCCRNLLIYLDSDAQKRILPLFHYTLLPEGSLMLGSSETIGSFSTLFLPTDNKWKIFQKKEIPISLRQQVHFPSGISHHDSVNPDSRLLPTEQKVNISRIAESTILNQLAPTVLIINVKGDILHIQGKSGKYLEHPSGPPSNNILDMAREGLKIELSSALRETCASGKEVLRKNIQVKTNGDYQNVNLRLKKIHKPKELSGYLMVIFEEPDIELENDRTKNGWALNLDEKEKNKFAALEKELQNTRESHQITIEELESSNEELKSTNEELQSSNEELQSTNEELESSKEELQSLNEELQTVNSELQSKLDELTVTNDDMRNLMNSTEIATIFVDNAINIKRFTPEATQIVNLIQTDVGRPFKHVVSNLEYDDMISTIENVIKNLAPIEKEVKTKDGSWYKMRILPYRTTDNRIRGAIITFSDINTQKKATNQAQKATNQAQKAWQITRNVFDLNKNPLVVIDIHGTIIIANSKFSSTIKASPESVEQKQFADLKQISLKKSEVNEIVNRTLKTKDFLLTEIKEKKIKIKSQTMNLISEDEPFVLLEFL